MKIAELLKSPESKTLEFKWDLSSPKNLLKTLVAFANTAGGRVVIGGLAWKLYFSDEIRVVDREIMKR